MMKLILICVFYHRCDGLLTLVSLIKLADFYIREMILLKHFIYDQLQNQCYTWFL
jgi:hypothetical protein